MWFQRLLTRDSDSSSTQSNSSGDSADTPLSSAVADKAMGMRFRREMAGARDAEAGAAAPAVGFGTAVRAVRQPEAAMSDMAERYAIMHHPFVYHTKPAFAATRNLRRTHGLVAPGNNMPLNEIARRTARTVVGHARRKMAWAAADKAAGDRDNSNNAAATAVTDAQLLFAAPAAAEAQEGGGGTGRARTRRARGGPPHSHPRSGAWRRAGGSRRTRRVGGAQKVKAGGHAA